VAQWKEAPRRAESILKKYPAMKAAQTPLRPPQPRPSFSRRPASGPEVKENHALPFVDWGPPRVTADPLQPLWPFFHARCAAGVKRGAQRNRRLFPPSSFSSFLSFPPFLSFSFSLRKADQIFMYGSEPAAGQEQRKRGGETCFLAALAAPPPPLTAAPCLVDPGSKNRDQ